MARIEKTFRLADEPGALGLSCDAEGVTLAGAPLVRKTGSGYAPRSYADTQALITAAYDGAISPSALRGGLRAICDHLNEGELARAQITAVRLGLPEVSWNGAARLADVERTLAKYDSAEPRDWHGRWTADDGGTKPTLAATTIRPRRNIKPRPRPLDVAPPRGRSSPTPTPPSQPRPSAAPSRAQQVADAVRRLYPALERSYDSLGPFKFSAKVSRFGYWLSQQAHEGRPLDLIQARAEYEFLQNRLDHWSGMVADSPREHNSLMKAALDLYTGAIAAGVVKVGEPGDWPKSMNAVAVSAMANEGSNPIIGTRRISMLTPPPPKPVITDDLNYRGQIDPHGLIISNDKVGIPLSHDIVEQGKSWEQYNDSESHISTRLHPNSKTFDSYIETYRRATSDKTIDTRKPYYGIIGNEKNIYYTLKRYIDAAADYKPRKGRAGIDLDPNIIEHKVVNVAIPEKTTAEQWRQIYRAASYARSRGVSLHVTRIRKW